MKIRALELSGLLLIEPVVYTDDRGHLFEAYHQERFARAGLELEFVQDNHSSSRRGVLRGLHAQLRRPQGKLIRVVRGSIVDVAVDIRPDSTTFGKSSMLELSAETSHQLWVPPGFAHGFYVLSDRAEVLYKCTAAYDPTDEIGVVWNDPGLAIDWPDDAPLLSAKDLALPTLDELRPRLESVAQRSR